MEITVHVEQERFSSTAEDDDDTQSYMDEEDVREVRLHHWLTETAVSARLAQDSAPALARADSPLLLGFDHQLPQPPLDSESDKQPLPSRQTLLSRLRSHSSAASTAAPSVGVAGAALHRRSPSHSQFSSASHSPALSRRPSLARQPSLPLLAESEPVPRSSLLSARQSSRLHSISSSLSLSAGRNAVYIDSEEIRTRLDQLLISGHSGLDHDDAQDLGIDDFYLKEQDSPSTPVYPQRAPPNTPMTAFFKTPCASSSQIYLGKTATSFTAPSEEDKLTKVTHDASPMELEDVRATPVPHTRPRDVDNPVAPAVSSSSESESMEGSPIFSIAASTTSRTSSNVSQFSVVAPQSNPTGPLSPKASLASLSQQAIIVPKASMNSIALGYQVPSPNSSMLSPPPVTASRWSLTSSLAGDVEKEKKKKEKGTTRKRFASLISKISGNSSGKEESGIADLQKESRGSTPTDLSSRDEDSEISVPQKSKSKPPSLKLNLTHSHSVSNLRSAIFSSQGSYPSQSVPLSPIKSTQVHVTATAAAGTPTLITSPVSATFSPTMGSFPTSASAGAPPASKSIATTGAATPSPPLPHASIQSEAKLHQPTLKTVASVPTFLPGWEGPGFLRREDSAGWSMRSGMGTMGSDSIPGSPIEDDDEEDDELDEGAEFYIRELGLTTSTFGGRRDEAEEERKARLSVITDMLERDLKAPATEDKSERKAGSGGLFYRSKRATKGEEREVVLDISRESPVHFRKPSGTDRTPSPTLTRRSAPSPAPRSPITPTPSALSSGKNSLRTLAARIGISNSTSHAPFLSSPAIPNGGAESPSLISKRKSLSGLMSSGSKRKAQRRRLVISGVGDNENEVAAIRSWCDSLGEVRSMVKVKSVQGEVTVIGQGDGCGQNVWVVDFKKGSVAERVCRLQAKVEIKGAGSVRLSWETKPKVGFNISAKGWVP